jgi:hypothetical protein
MAGTFEYGSPTRSPKWLSQHCPWDWQVQDFLNTLSKEQAAAAKVTATRDSAGGVVYVVFYPEA